MRGSLINSESYFVRILFVRNFLQAFVKKIHILTYGHLTYFEYYKAVELFNTIDFKVHTKYLITKAENPTRLASNESCDKI